MKSNAAKKRTFEVDAHAAARDSVDSVRGFTRAGVERQREQRARAHESEPAQDHRTLSLSEVRDASQSRASSRIDDTASFRTVVVEICTPRTVTWLRERDAARARVRAALELPQMDRLF